MEPDWPEVRRRTRHCSLFNFFSAQTAVGIGSAYVHGELSIYDSISALQRRAWQIIVDGTIYRGVIRGYYLQGIVYSG
jgi:hypothetical protein